jgi:hypothetical protein
VQLEFPLGLEDEKRRRNAAAALHEVLNIAPSQFDVDGASAVIEKVIRHAAHGSLAAFVAQDAIASAASLRLPQSAAPHHL